MRRAASPDPALLEQINQARQQAARPLSREEVALLIADMVRSMEGDISPVDLKIYQELESLARFIQTARAEIAAIRPQEIRSEFIPAATDELDAVVGATEEATGSILDKAERIMTVAAGLDEPVQSQLIDLVTGIFEACNFQDITGQRITKVVKTLKHIETRIDALVTVLGEEVQRARQAPAAAEPAAAARPAEEKLLNGPQLPSNAIDQDEIDRLLASFD